MEFHFGLWNGVSALYIESGRQLGEENTRPFALNHHIPAETIACKYKGSRQGRAINISALRIAMQNFDPALAITQAVRLHHLGQLPASHQLGIWDLFIIARASIALVAHQQRFQGQAKRKPARVSDELASQFQFISGVFMICRHMMENADPAIAENRPISAEDLYAYADEHGIFISFNGMACAGSTVKIHEFLQFCNSGGGQAADLSAMIGDPGNWYQYALATIELDCFIERERAVRQSDARGGGAESARISAQTYDEMGGYASSLMAEPFASAPEGETPFQEGALLRQNRILDLLGRSKIRAIPGKHVHARLG